MRGRLKNTFVIGLVMALGVGGYLKLNTVRDRELDAFILTLDGKTAWLGTDKQRPSNALTWSKQQDFTWLIVPLSSHCHRELDGKVCRLAKATDPFELSGTVYRAAWLNQHWAAYTEDPLAKVNLGPNEGRALAELVRHLLKGHIMPERARLPQGYVEPMPVEIMVTLRDTSMGLKTDRLWRSAKGNSIAEAVSTAAHAARLRWKERQDVLGGPLELKLPRLEIEVSMLVRNGSFIAPNAGWVAAHVRGHGRWGIGIEKKDAWYYTFAPTTLKDNDGKAPRHTLLNKLLKDHNMNHETLKRPDVKLYRFEVVSLGISPVA